MPPSIAEVHAELTAPGQMFEMEEVAIRGIPTRTWKLAPPSLRSVLEQSLMHGDLTFLVYEDDTLTFRQHFAAAATLAHRLVDDFGVRKGYASLYGLPEMPKPKELDALGERFRPYRSVAAWYLWRAADTVTPG